MSDHLPECPKSADRYAMAMCICFVLRACEQRVLDAARETVTDAGICTCTGSAWHGHDGSDDRCPVPTVLAAIDALRGER